MGRQDEDRPGSGQRFRIWVQGRLDEHFSDGLAGIEQEDVPAGTMLSGALLDQSQLHGTLDLLRSLGIGVLRFEVDPPPTFRYEGRRHHEELTERPGRNGTGHDTEERPDERSDRL